VFGEIDNSIYRRLSDPAAAAAGVRSKQTAGAAPADSETGYETASSSSSFGSEESDTDSTSSSERVGLPAGISREMQRTFSEGTEASQGPDEEGPSLRSQLLLGHLLLLASNAVAGPTAVLPAPAALNSSSSSATGAAAGPIAGTGTTARSDPIGQTLGLAAGVTSSSSSTSSMPPAGLQVLAGHLRRAGLLPKWVHWLLGQLPQRPELYERAFNRLFQQVRASCQWFAVGVTAAVHWVFVRTDC
jgi:hypothetical protein